MIPSIHALDETLINKIAAGEVVERPASVVKELVENSIDAGSKKIVVKIQDGGKKLIQVIDDGFGIAPNELPLAVARHATSKIQTFEDLYALHTKGFRGEALASIASVSQLEVASVRAGCDAQEIIVHGGQFIDQRACALAKGTKVTIKFLFYQTPARLKFLRTTETETAHVVDVVSQMALCHPDIHFTLFHNDKSIVDVPVMTDSLKRVTEVLGEDLHDWLYPFAGEDELHKVSGYFGHPQVARSQRKCVYLFVNGRAVNDKVLWHASLEAYRDILMKGKYPVLVLHLTVREDLLDVNVHPQKSEIRFHHPQQIHAFVKNVLRQHLQAAPWIRAQMQNANAPHSQDFTADANHLRNTFEPSKNSIQTSLQSWSQNYYQSTQPEISKKYTQADFVNRNSAGTQPVATTNSFAPEEQRQIQFGKTAYADMQPIGQWLGTYIVCEAQGKLVMIDQHAAHERVGFEKLMLQMQTNGLVREELLVPETFDLKPSDADILKNYLAELLEFGFDVEFFGGQTFVLKAVPVLLKGKIRFLDLIRDVLDDIRETGELKSLKDRLHLVLATMSCHAQIRANHHLTTEEMHALLRELDEYQFTDFCPHGRPVSVEVTKEEVEKWFRRVL